MSEAGRPTFSRTDWLLIGVLVGLVLPLRLWLLYNTEVTARDSVGYIRYALQFERLSWAEVLEKNHQHPGYPVLIGIASLPVRAIDGAPTPDNMQLSAQLVNLIASMILIVPMYLLGRQFFERGVSFGGTLLFQYLPVSAHHLSDGISEPFWLVLMVTGLLQGVHAVRDQSAWRGALCGSLAGLAYLVRPEGALLVPALLGTLLLLAFRAGGRSSWRSLATCGCAALLAALLVGSIYVSATGRITNKISALETLKNLWQLVAVMSPGADGSQLLNRPGQLFAASIPHVDHKGLRILYCVWALLAEMIQGLHYGASIAAVLGFCWSVRALRALPGYWLLVAHAVLHSFILIALAMSVRYVSDRHVMILVLSLCYLVAFALRELPVRLMAWLKVAADALPAHAWWRSASAWSLVLFAVLLGACLPKSTQRLHGNRVGNHAAGLWLAEHAIQGDHIEDDHAWSFFYSGFLFGEGRPTDVPADQIPTCYVVTTRSRDPQIDAVRQSANLTAQARVVYHWPERSEPDKARVVVHAQPRDFARNPWKKAPAP